MRRLKTAWLPILAGSIALALVATGVDAKKQPRPDPDPDYVTTLTDNWAMWDGGDHIYETPQGGEEDPRPRYCGEGGLGDPNPQGDVGYICHQFGPWPMENLLHITLVADWKPRDIGVEGRGADGFTAAELCALAEAEAGLVMNIHEDNNYGYDSLSRSYYYAMDPTWNDGPCIDDEDPNTCGVKAYTQAYFTGGAEHCNARGACGRLVELEGWGSVEPAGQTDGVWEYNPFSKGQNIEIKDLTVTFRAIRRDKVAARCHYDVPDQMIYFRTWNTDPSGFD